MIDTKKIIEDFAKSVVGKTINISIISDNNDGDTVVTTVDPRNFTTTTYGRDGKDWRLQ